MFSLKDHLLLDFNKDLSLKDFSESRLYKIKPNLQKIVEELKPLLPRKEFLTIDYSELVLVPGKTTCRDTGWHVDGKNNNYLILNIGVFRTIFLGEQIQISPEGDLRDFNKQLHIINKDKKGIEIEEGVPHLYSSLDIHRGQTANTNGKRILLRLCSSDYLSPKNKIITI